MLPRRSESSRRRRSSVRSPKHMRNEQQHRHGAGAVQWDDVLRKGREGPRIQVKADDASRNAGMKTGTGPMFIGPPVQP